MSFGREWNPAEQCYVDSYPGALEGFNFAALPITESALAVIQRDHVAAAAVEAERKGIVMEYDALTGRLTLDGAAIVLGHYPLRAPGWGGGSAGLAVEGALRDYCQAAAWPQVVLAGLVAGIGRLRPDPRLGEAAPPPPGLFTVVAAVAGQGRVYVGLGAGYRGGPLVRGHHYQQLPGLVLDLAAVAPVHVVLADRQPAWRLPGTEAWPAAGAALRSPSHALTLWPVRRPTDFNAEGGGGAAFLARVPGLLLAEYFTEVEGRLTDRRGGSWLHHSPSELGALLRSARLAWLTAGRLASDSDRARLPPPAPHPPLPPPHTHPAVISDCPRAQGQLRGKEEEKEVDKEAEGENKEKEEKEEKEKEKEEKEGE